MTPDDPWIGVMVLADPSRRVLYDYVRRAAHPVSREEAGDATDMSRGLAAFHLDKLVDVGHCSAGTIRLALRRCVSGNQVAMRLELLGDQRLSCPRSAPAGNDALCTLT